MARERLNGMDQFEDAPTGWAAFGALRRQPAPISPRRHGNWIHGRYSRARIEGMREFRQIARSGRDEPSPPLPESDAAAPIGWKAYRATRNQARFTQNEGRIQ